MHNPLVKVTLARTSTNRPAVRVSIKASNGRIYHSEPLAVGDAPIATLVKAAIAKAEGRAEADNELTAQERAQSLR